MKNSIDFSKIKVKGKLLGVLNLNLIIPIEEDQSQLVDATIPAMAKNCWSRWKDK